MARWTDYYNAVERQPPRPTLLGALKIWTKQPGTAVDLGCGTGRDSLELLQRGWKVHAIDAEAEAIRRLMSSVSPKFQDRLTPVCARFEDVLLPTCDLINASFSLPFCRPDRMQDLDHPNTIDGLHFTSTLPFVSAVRILPRERRTIQTG